MAALRLGGKEAVTKALKNALALEHATIPLYLYAYYSLDYSKNTTIADILHSVVYEEMLHMTLVCNLLNALKCDPQLDPPDIVPTYPGPLPGGVEAQLKVHLARYSAAQLCTFLTIESPEEPLEFPLRVVEPRPATIGDYYAAIKRQIITCGEGIFDGDQARQFGPDLMPGAVVVTDVTSATHAIDVIVTQGEGTSESPAEAVESQEFAHYYRFAEIAHNRKLIKNPAAGQDAPPDKRYIYGGDVIPFDVTGVYPVPTDPRSTDYPAGSPTAKANAACNYTYTSILKTLHVVFNGHLDQFAHARDLMVTLDSQVGDMMSGASTGGVHAGPSFEWQPVPPS
jgi:hypothetical protein